MTACFAAALPRSMQGMAGVLPWTGRAQHLLGQYLPAPYVCVGLITKMSTFDRSDRRPVVICNYWQVWNRIQRIGDSTPNGTICLSRDLDSSQVLPA